MFNIKIEKIYLLSVMNVILNSNYNKYGESTRPYWLSMYNSVIVSFAEEYGIDDTMRSLHFNTKNGKVDPYMLDKASILNIITYKNDIFINTNYNYSDYPNQYYINPIFKNVSPKLDMFNNIDICEFMLDGTYDKTSVNAWLDNYNKYKEVWKNIIYAAILEMPNNSINTNISKLADYFNDSTSLNIRELILKDCMYDVIREMHDSNLVTISSNIDNSNTIEIIQKYKYLYFIFHNADIAYTNLYLQEGNFKKLLDTGYLTVNHY